MTPATINGSPIAKLVVQIPACGVWWAELETQAELDLTRGDSAEIVIADITLYGTVVSGGDYAGRGFYRVAAGEGRWGTAVAAKGYASSLGVSASLVVSDVAAETGESCPVRPTNRLGEHYARTAGPASRVLHDVAPLGWYVDFGGVTRFGLRAATTYVGTAPRTRVAPGSDVIEVTPEEEISTLVPGVSIDGSAAATDVEYALDDRRLTVRVYAGESCSRRASAYQKIVEALDPRRLYRGTFEFRVVTQVGERLNLQPVRSANGLPDLALVPTRYAAGVRATHALGSLVLVTFVDADPSRPVVIGGDAPDSPGWMPTALSLGEDPVLGVARIGDVAGPWAIATGSLRVKAGL